MTHGDYQLVLESFDNNSSVKSTLKKDSFTITVLFRGIRDVQAPSLVKLDYMSSTTLNIANIRSVAPLSAPLNIQMRQKTGSEIQWVSIEQGSLTFIHIDGCSVMPGDYILVLESYDKEKPDFLLFTDQITIKIDQIKTEVAKQLQATFDSNPLVLKVTAKKVGFA